MPRRFVLEGIAEGERILVAIEHVDGPIRIGQLVLVHLTVLQIGERGQAKGLVFAAIDDEVGFGIASKGDVPQAEGIAAARLRAEMKPNLVFIIFTHRKFTGLQAGGNLRLRIQGFLFFTGGQGP